MIRRPPRSTPLSLHDALPICYNVYGGRSALAYQPDKGGFITDRTPPEPYVSNFKVMQEEMSQRDVMTADRKSTRLNSSHSQNSYAGFCLKKKKQTTISDTSNV